MKNFRPNVKAEEKIITCCWVVQGRWGLYKTGVKKPRAMCSAAIHNNISSICVLLYRKKTQLLNHWGFFNIICFPQISSLILLTIISPSREHLIPGSNLISLCLHWPTTCSSVMLLQYCVTSKGALIHCPDTEDEDGNLSQTQPANRMP